MTVNIADTAERAGSPFSPPNAAHPIEIFFVRDVDFLDFLDARSRLYVVSNRFLATEVAFDCLSISGLLQGSPYGIR